VLKRPLSKNIVFYHIENKGKIGNKNEDFYYILQGSVEIYCPTKVYKGFENQEDYENFKNENKEKIVSDRKIRGDEDISDLVQDIINPDPLLYTAESIKIEFKFLEKIIILQPGDSFGELTFYPQCTIPASFQATENSILAKINRKQYSAIIKDAMNKKVVLYRSVFKNVPFFKGFSEWALDKLAAYVVSKDYGSEQCVYKEGDDVQNLYIIKEGEFEERKNLKIVSDNTGSPKIKLPGSLIDQIHKRSPFNNLKNEAGIKKISIKSIYSYNVFGHEEIMAHIKTRMNSVYCKSQKGTLLILEKKYVMRAINTSCLQFKVKEKAEKEIITELDRVENNSKYLHLELPRIQRLRKKRESEPMSTAERNKIRLKVNRIKEESLQKIIKRAVPNYKIDLTHQFYDSQVIRGQKDPPSIRNIINFTPSNTSLPSIALHSPNISMQDLTPSPNPSPSLQRNKIHLRKHSSNPMLKQSAISLSTFLTGISPKTDATPNSNQIFDAVICKHVSDKNVVNIPFQGVLTDVANEVVEQYKILNNGNMSVPKENISKVINSIVQSSAYMKKIVDNVKLVQRKCSQKIIRSKHNLYRFSSVS